MHIQYISLGKWLSLGSRTEELLQWALHVIVGPLVREYSHPLVISHNTRVQALRIIAMRHFLINWRVSYFQICQKIGRNVF